MVNTQRICFRCRNIGSNKICVSNINETLGIARSTAVETVCVVCKWYLTPAAEISRQYDSHAVHICYTHTSKLFVAYKTFI